MAREHCILLNGPPRSGKDTLAGILQNMGPAGTTAFKMSYPIKVAVPELMGISWDRWKMLQGADPETPCSELLGFSPRGIQISLSEDWFKPVFGNDVFGRLFLNRKREVSPQIAVISDAGFEEECLPIVEEYGPENVSLVQIVREGTSFENDSRNWIQLDNVLRYKLSNNGTINDLQQKAKMIIPESLW